MTRLFGASFWRFAGLLAGLAACFPGARALDSVLAPRPVNAPTQVRVLPLLRQTVSAGARTAAAWPGFNLHAQVLLLVIDSAGPVYLVGDARPPREYELLDGPARIAARTGPPPDSLRGLQVGLSWNGGHMNATAVTVRGLESAPYIPHMLVHEAFHTFQRQIEDRDVARFAAPPAASFPSSSVPALAQLNLEGAYLAAALREPNDLAARSLAVVALALRETRCRILGTRECAAERALELVEGTAAYVTAHVLGEATGYGGPAVWRDSMAKALSPVSDPRRLERWHFYDTGHAWLLLLERLAPPVRISFGHVRSLASATRTLPDGTSEMVVDVGANRVVIRGPARAICCPGQMAVAVVSGHTAQVDGRPVPLDQPGAALIGRIALRLSTVEVQFERGELRVFRDSIRVSALPADAPPTTPPAMH